MHAPLVARRVAATLAALTVAGCAPAVAPSTELATTTSSTLLTRLGSDTVSIEQYTRTASRMDGIVVSRAPFATIARYTIQLGADAAPASAEFSIRRGDGTPLRGAMESLSIRYRRDSLALVGHRAAGDTMRMNVARPMVLPFIENSYAIYELAVARLLASGRDSADFSATPMNFNARNSFALPVKLYGGDSVRVAFFGSPLYARHDGRGGLLYMDGRQTTVKVRVDRVAATDLEALARTWSARDASGGAVGATSTRDTARATLAGADVWVDYGRPSLRGRDVWVNGVLGDTIWRTGANAATQLKTDRELVIGGMSVPAGTYSLWTWAGRSGYHLIVNRQSGQWGTEYDAARDQLRVPLRESTSTTTAERFTIAFEPQGPTSAALVLAWGTKRLSVPVSTK